MQRLVYKNPNGVEIDLTSGDFGVTSWDGFSDTMLEVQSQQVPFQDGSVYLDSLLSERELSVTVAVNDDNDLEKRYELKRQMITALNPKIGEGELIYTNDYLSKKIKCIPHLPKFSTKNINNSGSMKAKVDFTASNPYWEDMDETKLYLYPNEQVNVVNNGDVPCSLDIDLYGLNAENPFIANATTNKKIKYIGTVNSSLKIKTQMGEKIVRIENFSVQTICGGSFQSIASGNNEIVVTGSILKTSNNGINWTNESFESLPSALTKIKFIKEKNCYYGLAGYSIAKSYDGKNWEIIYTTATSIISNIIYNPNLDLFCAVGNNTIFTSPDGETWTEITVNGNWADVSYNDSYMVVVGYQKIIYSSDGDNWTQSTTNITSDLYSIACDENGYFVTVGRSGAVNYCSGSPAYWSSKSTGINYDLNDVYCDDVANIFIIVGDNGTILTLDDINSTFVTRSSGVTKDLSSVIYSNFIGMFYIVGGGTILTSYDMITWDIQSTILSRDLTSIIYDEVNDIYIGISKNYFCAKSLDGFTWEIVFSGDAGYLYYIKETGLFVVLGNNLFYTSTDGEIWTSHNLGVTTTFTNITYSGDLDLYVVCSMNGDILTSPDLDTWTQRTSGVSTRLYGLVYSEEKGLFVCCGWNSVILTSPDGENWTQRTSGITYNFEELQYIKEKEIFIIIHANELLVSSNGTTWTNEAPGNYQNITLVYYNSVVNQLCVFVNGEGKVYTSPDGYVWDGTQYSYGDSITVIQDFDYSPDLKLFVASVGNNLALSDNGLTWTSQPVEMYNYLLEVKWIPNKKYFYIYGQNSMAGYSDFNLSDNVIDGITEDSDMGLNLIVGNNLLRYLSDNRRGMMSIKYKQKYLGV